MRNHNLVLRHVEFDLVAEKIDFRFFFIVSDITRRLAFLRGKICKKKFQTPSNFS